MCENGTGKEYKLKELLRKLGACVLREIGVGMYQKKRRACEHLIHFELLIESICSTWESGIKIKSTVHVIGSKING